MIWLFVSSQPVAPGLMQRAILAHNGDRASAFQAMKQEAVRLNIPLAPVKYECHRIPENDPASVVLCTQLSSVVLDPAYASGGQPSGNLPRGQKGQNKQDGPVGMGGFQELGDTSLPVNNDDNVFGESEDGTYTDIILDGGGAREVQR